MSWKIFLPILIAVMAIGAGVYLFTSRDGATPNTITRGNGDILVLSPQNARTSVIIDRVTMAQAGFVVVRGGDGRRIGQVIEISSYLPAATYESIEIELGDFYTYTEGDELVAMIYRDEGDQTFNELDEPLNATAVFVKTAEAVPASVFAEQIAPTDGMEMVTVRYTNNGFEPKRITVPTGTMVDFINQSDGEMWVASNIHPEHEILPTFDQFKGIGKGQSYMYVFDKKGAWSYHDHINPAFEGVINVE